LVILDLKINESGTITELPKEFPLMLEEIGFMIGSVVKLVQIAPLNDPIYLIVNGSHLVIRKENITNIKITQ